MCSSILVNIFTFNLSFAVGYEPKKVEIESENIHYIGDCDKVGTLKDAITCAHELAKNI